MPLPDPQPGLVIRYNFLWRSEAEDGRDDGRKARPCAIITMVRRAGDKTLVTVVPITHSPPADHTAAIEMPLAAKKMLGLDDERSWIVTDELNTFIWPGTDIEPISPGSRTMSYGLLPKALLIVVLRRALGYVRSGRAKSIRRTE